MTVAEPDIAGMKARKVNQDTYILHKRQHYSTLVTSAVEQRLSAALHSFGMSTHADGP
jgi:hypothetical protein